MTPEQFADELARAGFEPAVTVTREAGGMLGDPTHPFEAKALILSGDIRIATAALERVYQTGDVFHLAAEDPHSEFYGMLGVQYLVGRKTPAAACAHHTAAAWRLRSAARRRQRSSRTPARWTPK